MDDCKGYISRNSSTPSIFFHHIYVDLRVCICIHIICFTNCRLNEKPLPNGDVYIGEVKGVLPHGKGEYTWSDRTVYEGDWEEGKMTGKGVIMWPSGAKYEGEFSGNYLHGYGTFTLSSGSVYRGGWRMNAQHGIGRKEYSNSDIYEGLWKEGVPEGSGRYSWNHGNTFIGNWKGGKIEGRGVMRWANGDAFDGCWSKGLRHGSGVYRYADGGVYMGTWSKGLKDGKGTFFPAGSKHPTLKKWCSSLTSDNNGSILNSGEPRAPKSKVKRSLSEKVLVSGSLSNSRHISQRTSSLDGSLNQHDSAQESMRHDSSRASSLTSDEGQSEARDKVTWVYEREYMQGVLIMERTRKYSELSHKKKWKNEFSVQPVKRSSCVDIFGSGHQSHYLKLNLQLGIR